MRINEETTGCQFISLATLFRVSLLRLPRATTTCTIYIYIYIYEDPTCHQRERKERKRGDRVGSFRPTGGEALRGSFCHLVVSFYGSSPSSSRIQTKRTAYTKRRFAIDNFPAPVSISFMLFLMSITIGHRPIILPAKICEIIVQLYLLSFSIRVFFLFFRSSEGTMFFLLILIK